MPEIFRATKLFGLDFDEPNTFIWHESCFIFVQGMALSFSIRHISLLGLAAIAIAVWPACRSHSPITEHFTGKSPSSDHKTQQGMPILRQKLVLASLVARFGNPHSPYSYGNTQNLAKVWGTWHWMQPPVCVSNQSYGHQPQNYRPLTIPRRDVAVSTDQGQDILPLIGAYHSADPDVLKYQISLAQAMHIDAFVVDYYGKARAEKALTHGNEAIDEDVLRRIFPIANLTKDPFKIAIMYEAKVHFNPNGIFHNSFDERKNGIAADLIHYISTYAHHPSMLKLENKAVVFVFRQRQCDGNRCLEDTDWSDIVQRVKSATGEDLLLIGTSLPSQAQPSTWYSASFTGMLPWHLLSLPIMRYRNFVDFDMQTPTPPPPTIAMLQQHVGGLHANVNSWANFDSQRIGVGIVYPGFADDGVVGWSQENFAGEDNQPLCVRVTMNGADFFETTYQSALAANLDWLHLSTFNDWQELTQIEPVFDATYWTNVMSGQQPTLSTLQQVFKNTNVAQMGNANFKGKTIQPNDGLQKLHEITVDYLLDSNAYKYD